MYGTSANVAEISLEIEKIAFPDESNATPPKAVFAAFVPFAVMDIYALKFSVLNAYTMLFPLSVLVVYTSAKNGASSCRNAVVTFPSIRLFLSAETLAAVSVAFASTPYCTPLTVTDSSAS